jgi:hypothetical protein
MKYKLIKKLPFENSPEIGYISKPTPEKDGTHYWNHNWFNPKEYPEYWEKVAEKDYEIIAVRYQHNNNIYIWDSKQFCCDGGVIDLSCVLKGYVGTFKDGYKIYIYTVKRLSDGIVFTVGDRVKQSNVKHNNIFTITGFEMDVNNEHLLAIGNGGIKLKKIEHYKAPLFTTEDGVDIYEGERVYIVETAFNIVYSGNLYWKPIGVTFSNKQAAEEYVLMNKPCLSIKEIAPIIGQCNNTTHIDLDSLTEKLKKLVKGRHV